MGRISGQPPHHHHVEECAPAHAIVFVAAQRRRRDRHQVVRAAAVDVALPESGLLCRLRPRAARHTG
uniref:Uncharacterized protein n=1 Tax=Bursaphelenchus xylophilus TaxID=6326 RepID=A0A1I7SGJ2_BURXY